MKKLFITAFMAASMFSIAQTTWKIDGSHSKIGFDVTHLTVSEVEGRLKIYDGKIVSKSDKDFTDATIQFLGDVTSINTDDEKRDAHLKSADFFDTDKFPKMIFTSTSMKKGAGKTYTLVGDLTIKGITKKVTFEVVYNGTTEDPWKNTKAGFVLKGTIKRSDFGVGSSTPSVIVSDDVKIDIKVELLLQK
ncbi:MAG: YceI family protein [Bacteroidetes bacterium]|nr:YceI family protein [Bacteroidota bacterium]